MLTAPFESIRDGIFITYISHAYNLQLIFEDHRSHLFTLYYYSTIYYG